MFNKLKYLLLKSNRWHRLLVLVLISQLRILPRNYYGFWCKDPALSHPYTGDTITLKWLFGVTIILPLLVITIVEKRFKTNAAAPKNRTVPIFLEYFYGLLLNLVVVHLVKQLVGSPRPHFFDTCKPAEAETCKESEFISSYTCSDAGHWAHRSDTSFPSGHTALATHCALFTIWYLRWHKKMRGFHSLCAQLACAALAAWCAYSRAVDRRHHWWDLVGGAAISLLVTTYYTVAKVKTEYK